MYEYRFAPDQDTKLDAGKSCLVVDDLSGVTIKSIDRARGLVGLSLGKDRAAPADAISIMVDDIVNAKGIAESIYRTVLAYSLTGVMPAAL